MRFPVGSICRPPMTCSTSAQAAGRYVQAHRLNAFSNLVDKPIKYISQLELSKLRSFIELHHTRESTAFRQRFTQPSSAVGLRKSRFMDGPFTSATVFLLGVASERA